MTWLVMMGLTNAALAVPLAAVALAVSRWSRRPALSHVLWVLVLLKLLTPPLVEIPVGWKIDLAQYGWQTPQNGRHPAAANVLWPPKANLPPVSAVSRTVDVASHTTASAEGQRAESLATAAPVNGVARTAAAALAGNRATISRHAAWPAWLISAAVIVWVVGSVAMLLLMLVRGWRFWSFLEQLVERDEILERRVSRLAYIVGLSARPQVCAVRGAVSPMLWGIGSSARLIFPVQLARELNAAACDSLLLHELAHFSRGDQWVRLLELAAQVLFWWHPVVWLARREIEAAEEQCCDAWVVLQQQGTPRAYADALLAAIDFLCAQPALPPAASGLGDVPLLRARLTQIMRGDAPGELSRAVNTALLVIGIIVLPLGPALLGASVRPDRLTPKAATAQRAIPVAEQVSPAAIEPSPTPPVQPSESDVADPAQPQVAATTVALPAKPRRVEIPWARAIAPGGKYQLEVRRGLQTTLVTPNPNWRPDLSHFQMRSVSFLPDGRSFISGHEEGHVRIWDSETGGLVSSLKGSTAAIWSVAAAPDGRRVAAGAADGSVLVWDLLSGDELARLSPRDVPVSCLRWSQRGDRLAISLGDFTDAANAALLIWSADGSPAEWEIALEKPAGALAWLDEDRDILLAGWDGEGQVWNVESQSPSLRATLDKNAVKAANWSPDCPLLVTSPLSAVVTKAE